MAEKFDTWASYFYPETYDPVFEHGTLKNLLGERDPSVLRQKEYARVAVRFEEVLSGSAGIQRSFDAEHVTSIHGYLFQDVYEWAGDRELLRQMHHSSVPRKRSEARIDEMTPA